jgi:hypothetical protein
MSLNQNNSCNTFDEKTFFDTLNEINDTITKGELQENLKALAEEPCININSLTGGKRRSRKRSMKGGKMPIKNIIKTLLYVLIAALVSLGLNSPNLQTVKDGLLMIYNGQCNSITNRIWSWVGIENPVCALYNNLLFKIIPNALLGNSEALTKLVGMFSIGFGGPIIVIRQIDNIGALVEDTVNNAFQIENNGTPNNNNQEEAISNELTLRGGLSLRGGLRKKRKSKRRRTRKYKK